MRRGGSGLIKGVTSGIWLLISGLFSAPSIVEAGSLPAIQLSVDATDAPRRIFHVREEIPVSGNEVTLYFVKWIPGEHSPSGQIVNLVNLGINSGDQPLAWRRDPTDMFSFHISVPKGANSIGVTFDYVSPFEGFDFQGGVTATTHLAIINWNQVLLYPQGHRADELIFAAQLQLPAGWEYGTALPVDEERDRIVRFAPVSLTTLVDSPVNMGSYHRHIDLWPGSDPSYSMDLVAESAAALQVNDAALSSYERLVREANQLFGGPHRYPGYRFLVTLSDPIAKIAQEHHESSDDRFTERSLVELDSLQIQADVLPHEFVHAWNGKSRRPRGLATTNYQEPMKDDLLWVYEGLTQYLGEVLAARSGAWSAATYRENLALTAAMLDHRAGRRWRPLADTAVAAQLLYFAPESWANLRRGTDFYPEGSLIWLAADTQIRSQTHGERSLDDFCRAFFGHPEIPPKVSTYTYEDLIAALHRITAYDWKTFFRRTVQGINERAPLDGIEAGGWKLVYTDSMPELQKSRERVMQTADLSYSLGLVIQSGGSDGRNGRISDVLLGSPAEKAGMSPGMRLIAVAGRKWSPEILREAVQAAVNSTEPIELLIENDEFFTTFRLDYHRGELYPQLQRVTTHPDVIAEIVKSQLD